MTEGTPSFSAILIPNLTDKTPVENFNCFEKVYLYITLHNVYGDHWVTALWIDPSGKQKDEVDLPFVSKRKKFECWLVLEFLNVEAGGHFLTPSQGSIRFSGKWKVQLLLDGNFLEEKEFTVTCG